MSEQKSEEWLPVGWTVELEVRKNGRKDKCYIAPSGGLKFHSKPEVSRYLNDVQINHTKSDQKKKGACKRSAGNVVFEKVVAEGLPEGWIKEFKVTKKARTIRRDPYYTDPVSGYVFRSMKDVLRYLKTGELGRLAVKPKDRGSSDVELEDAKVSSPAAAERQKLASCRTRGQIIRGQSLNSNEIVKDEQILNSACIGECMLLSQHTSDQCGEGTELSSFNLAEAKDSEQIEGKSDSVLAPAVGTLEENKPAENGVVSCGNRNTQLRVCKSKDKKGTNLPHRSSKRLAGLEIDPTPELKTTNRARRIAIRQSKQSSEAEAGSWAQQFDQLEAEREAKCTEVLTSNNSENPFADLATPEDGARKVEKENKVDEKLGCPLVLPLGNLAIPEEHKADEKPGSPIVLPFGDSWADPCIEFAVKTLTGAIPVGGDLDIQDYFQQLTSSSTQVGGGLTSQNVRQTDLFCQQLDTAKKPAFEQNSGETGLHQHGEEK